MKQVRNVKGCRYLIILLMALLVGCTSTATAKPTPVPATPTSLSTPGDLFQSNGGGEPRSPGYWLLWNSCAPGNQAATAAANGGRQAGWVIMDDLIQDPGLAIGDLSIKTCQQGINLLSRLDLDGGDRSDDAAYHLAQGLLTAELNLSTGGESCPAAEQAVLAGHLLLASLDFNGRGDYLVAAPASKEQETAMILVEHLETYNIGELCR